MPTPSSTAWSITPTGLTSTGKACGEPVNPAERPEPVALWTCRCAWTTPRGVAHMPTAEAAEKQVLKPRFKIDHAALPMPENRRPERLAPRATSNRKCGRDHLGILGEIKSVHPGEIVGISSLCCCDFKILLERGISSPSVVTEPPKKHSTISVTKMGRRLACRRAPHPTRRGGNNAPRATA